MLVLNIIISTLLPLLVHLVTIHVLIVLLLICHIHARNVKPDYKGILLTILVSATMATLMTDFNLDVKHVLMLIQTVLHALILLIQHNQLLFIKISSIKQHGPPIFYPTLPPSLVWLLTLSTLHGSVNHALHTASLALIHSPAHLVTLHHLPFCTLTTCVTCVICQTVCHVILTMCVWVVQVFLSYQKVCVWRVYRHVFAMDGSCRK